MLVGERMSHPVIHIPPSMTVPDAIRLLQREKIRRAPVVKDGELVGMVADKDLLHASASSATSLSIWELNYLLSKIQVRDVMTKEVITVEHDTPIEEAARIMADNKIGGLPVMRDGHVVGIITETDLFKIFLEMMGAREQGVRTTVLVMDKPGVLGRLGEAMANMGANIIALGTFAGEDPSNREVTFKVTGIDEAEVREQIESIVEEIRDIRVC